MIVDVHFRQKLIDLNLVSFGKPFVLEQQSDKSSIHFLIEKMFSISIKLYGYLLILGQNLSELKKIVRAGGFYC